MLAKAFWLLPLMVVVLVVGLFFLDAENKPTTDDIAAVPAPGPAPDGMAWIPGGTFLMGSPSGVGMVTGGPEYTQTVEQKMKCPQRPLNARMLDAASSGLKQIMSTTTS